MPLGIIRDDIEEQTTAAIRGLEMADVLVFSAGSSVSSRDMTAQIINNLGQPGVLIHGLAIRPGKPTVIGLVKGKPAFGLPGNPVSSVVGIELLVRPALKKMQGLDDLSRRLPVQVDEIVPLNRRRAVALSLIHI